ncbi:restriction endonuclease subunit S [Shewanella xiamenensis]|nr:restriction endonuclease subunit S [Shewanella xiamenensis]
MSKYDAYKNSGVEWLGDIPSSWMLKRFKHHYRSAMGETILASDLVVDGSIPVFSATEGSHFFGYVNSSGVILERGDLVIPARGNSIGFPKLVDQKSTCSQTTIYAKQIKKISQSFCFYYLLGCKPYLFQFVQTAIPQITVDEVKNNWLVVPSIEEQTRIANFLDKKTAQIDEAIAIKEQQINLLKERKQIIIQQAVTQGLDPNVPMKDSGVNWIGKVPAHWEVRRSKFVFTQRKERAWKDDVQLSATQAYGVIPQDQYEELTGKRVVKIQFHLDKRKHVEKDDFVISMRSFQGGLERAWSQGCIRSSYVVLRALDEIDPSFYGYLLKLPSYIAALQQTASFIRDGQDLNFDNFSKVDLFIPPIEEQKEIANYVSAFMKSSDGGIELLFAQIEKLKEYKTTLINSAVTGKIKITPEMVEQ